MNEIQIQMTGNLVADPKLTYTPKGTAVTRFRVASTPRYQKDGEWVNGETVYLNVVAWKTLAENVAEKLRKGNPVMVDGRLRQRPFETEDGQKRRAYEVIADTVAPILRSTTTAPAAETTAPTDPAEAPAA